MLNTLGRVHEVLCAVKRVIQLFEYLGSRGPAYCDFIWLQKTTQSDIIRFIKSVKSRQRLVLIVAVCQRDICIAWYYINDTGALGKPEQCKSEQSG